MQDKNNQKLRFVLTIFRTDSVRNQNIIYDQNMHIRNQQGPSTHKYGLYNLSNSKPLTPVEANITAGNDKMIHGTNNPLAFLTSKADNEL